MKMLCLKPLLESDMHQSTALMYSTWIHCMNVSCIALLRASVIHQFAAYDHRCANAGSFAQPLQAPSLQASKPRSLIASKTPRQESRRRGWVPDCIRAGCRLAGRPAGQHSVNTQSTLSQHPVNIQSTSSQHPVNIQ